MPWHYFYIINVSAGTVNIRDVVICKTLNVGTVAVHGIKLVIVIRVGKYIFPPLSQKLPPFKRLPGVFPVVEELFLSIFVTL